MKSRILLRTSKRDDRTSQFFKSIRIEIVDRLYNRLSFPYKEWSEILERRSGRLNKVDSEQGFRFHNFYFLVYSYYLSLNREIDRYRGTTLSLLL